MLVPVGDRSAGADADEGVVSGGIRADDPLARAGRPFRPRRGWKVRSVIGWHLPSVAPGLGADEQILTPGGRPRPGGLGRPLRCGVRQGV
jgi:hypothetical protein